MFACRDARTEVVPGYLDEALEMVVGDDDTTGTPVAFY
jgi:hypothetical protein